MNMKTGLAALAFLATSVPAFAVPAATITFYPNAAGAPTYSTASVVQSFATPQVNNANFAANSSNAAGTSEAYTGAASKIRTGGSAVNTVGQYLNLKGATYTLNFDSAGFAQGAQYVSFLLNNYKTTSSVVLNYVGGGNSGNILSTLAGLGTTASTNHGLIVIDQGSTASIASISFTAGAAAGGELAIDQIAAAAPEPAAWLMMILGFGLAGVQLRNRRRAAVKFAAA